MLVVQSGTEGIIVTEWVYYIDSGSDGALAPGYVLCMDINEHDSPQAGEFEEFQSGRVYTKPKTANLSMPKRVVLTPPQDLGHSSSNDGWVKVIHPKLSSNFIVNVEGTTDVAVGDPLVAVNEQWYLIKDASPGQFTTVCLAAETQDADSVVGIKGTGF